MEVANKDMFYLNTPIGFLEVCTKNHQLVSIGRANVRKNMILDQNLSPFAQSIKQQIYNYFQGKLKSFNIPLRLEGTVKQKKVWKALYNTPYGKTKTYGQIALELNFLNGARFIGQCCAKNPCLIIVPCHRILAQKNLGGFVLGLKAKKYLLKLEKTFFL